MIAPKGYVKIARKAFDPEHGDTFWLEPRIFSKWEAWVDLIQQAAFRARRYLTKYGPIDLGRGEFVAAIRKLAERWQWHKNAVHHFLSTLKKTGRIEGRKTGRYGTVYLIVNYDLYQNVKAETGTQDGTENGTTAGRTRDKKEEGEEVEAIKTGAIAPTLHHSWTTEGTACWVEMVGRMTAGRFGKVLKPFVDKHGWPVVRATMVRWIIEQQALGKVCKLEWFADGASAQIALPPQDILDEYGGLTAYGKRLVAGVK